MSDNHSTCPNVVTDGEGTSYCGMAETAVLALRKKLAERLLTPTPRQGMKVNGLRILRQNGTGYGEMRKQMAAHLEELARRYYAGEIYVVDEFLQLYCFGEDERKEAAP